MNVGRRLRARRLRSAAGSINSGRHILESRCADRCANDAFSTSFRATLKEKMLSQKCAVNEERGRKNVRGTGRLAVVPLEDQVLVMTRFRIRLGWLQQELAYIFGVSEACVSLTFQEVD